VACVSGSLRGLQAGAASGKDENRLLRPRRALLHRSYSWAPPVLRRRVRDTRPTPEVAIAAQQPERDTGDPKPSCAAIAERPNEMI
jgi:hypothetical protein